MRGTSHNGRAGKNGTYSAKHNDRNFNLNSAEHIDVERTSNNSYWHRYQTEAPEMTFEQAESKFYEDNFTDALNAKNERYRASGHKERMKTMDEYRENRLSCPEETLLQVGKTGDSIDAELLKKICIQHIEWERKTFPNVKVLDVALHVDEEGAPHIHERKVWVAHSPEGLIVGQAKALDEMHIERPHPEKRKDRYNNPKTTYTAMCREHFIEVCKEHGIKIESEPDRTSKRGLELEEYKKQQEQEKLKGIEAQVETANKQLKKVLDMKARASEIHKIFGDKQTQSYHKNMLEQTRAIGTEAYENMRKAQLAELAVADDRRKLKAREQEIKSKEDAIEPLHEQAQKAKEDAEEYKNNIVSYIVGTAQNIVKDELIPEKDQLSDKMRDFMSGYNINGKPLDKIFEEQLERECQRTQRECNEKLRNVVNERDDWDLDL